MHNRTIKNTSYLLLCLLFVGGFIYTKQQNVIEKEVSVLDYENYRQVVYSDQDGILIPVSYLMEEHPTIQSEAIELFALMKNPEKLNPQLHSVIEKDTNLKSAILENDILQLHFENIQQNNELRFLEACAFVFCQLDGVKGIDLYVSGEKINQLPEGNIVLSEPLDDSLGMNNFEASQNDLYKTKAVTVYYSKNINQEEVYVPVSKRILKSSSLQTELEHIVGEISVSSTLDQASLLKDVEILEGSYLEDGHLYVNMNDAVLFDETTIDNDIYDLLLLSFSQIDDVLEVTLLVEGEAIETRDTVSVSDIVYNIVKY